MRGTLRVLAAVGIAILLLAAAVGVGAEGEASSRVSPMLGPGFRISGPNATSYEDSPVVAWNQAANEYLVVWLDSRGGATRGYDIYGRRVGAGGAVIGGDFRISGPNATESEDEPAVVWNQTAGEYLVVWQDVRDSPTRGADIYGQRVSAGGAVIGDDFRISGPNATESEDYPAVAWNQTANQYLVVWEDDRSLSTRDSDIYGRRVSPGGAVVGGDFRISGPNALSYEDSPAVAWNQTANQYLVVWEDWRNLPTRPDIYGRRVGAAGAVVGGDFRISGPNAISSEKEAAVVSNQTAGEYLVVWADLRNSPTRGWDIYGRRVGADGARIGGDFRIGGGRTLSDDESPAVAWNETADEYLVVWTDERNGSTWDSDIYGRRVGPDGAGIGGDFGISGPNALSYEDEPAVAWNQTANQYLVVWTDARNDLTRGYDIYGRRVTG